MKTTIFLVVLLYVFCTASSAFTRQQTDCSKRNSLGLICSEDCKGVATCLKTYDGWKRVELDTCFGNQTCNLIEGGCSDKPGACTSFGEMTCDIHGTFPDPFDCQRFYTCAGEGADSSLGECPAEFAYNVVSQECDIKMADAENCKKLPVECKTLGQNDAWPWNPNLYYVCKNKIFSPEKKVLYPALLKCNPGRIYSPEQGCHD